MLLGLMIFLWFLAWGAHAVVPWRLVRSGGGPAGTEPAARRTWAYAALPLLFAGAAAALLAGRAQADAALATGMVPLLGNLPGRLLAMMFPAVLLADGLLLLGRRKLEAAGWALAAGLGVLLLAAAAFAGELLRVGEGPPDPLPVVLAAAACRLLLGLAAGEVLAPGRPLLAVAAALAVPTYLYLLPGELQRPLLAGIAWTTPAAATLLLAIARWLPARLCRPALAAGALLACLLLGQAARLSQELGNLPLAPLPPLQSLPAQ